MEFNKVPLHQDMQAFYIRTTGVAPNRQFTVVFYYPDGSREFDGRQWVAKPNNPQATITDWYKS